MGKPTSFKSKSNTVNIIATGAIVVTVFYVVSLFWPSENPSGIENNQAALRQPGVEVVAQREAADKRAEADRVAANAAIEAEFKASRTHIMKMLRDLMDRKGYIAAVAWGERFAEVEDAEFQELYGKARRLNGMQQTEMKKKMDAKEARLNNLQGINTGVEGTHAISYCQNLVRAELKAPGQAKFPMDTDVQVTGTNERFIVHSFVDAPNSFNAITRTPYFCRLYYNGGGRSGWNIEEFRVGE